MKKVTSLLLLAGVAAFGLAGCGDDDEGFIPPDDDEAVIESVSVTPSEVTVEPGQTAQVRVDFQTSGGVEGISVEWTSGNTDVATVDPTGDQTAQVTGQSSGTVTITATVSASNAQSQSASAGVDVTEIEDASLSIGSITDSLDNPVDVSNVSDQINVSVDVDKGDETPEQVALLLDDEVVSTQDFASGNVETTTVKGQGEVEQVVFSFRTDRLEGSTPDDVITAANMDRDGNVKNGQFPNGEHTISAELTTASGATRTATNSQTLTFNNGNLSIAAHLSGGQGVVEPNSGARYWGGEDISVSITPVIYDGTEVGSVTVSSVSGNQTTTAGGGPIVFDSNTVSSEPFVFDILQADNAGGVENARGAPDGPGGFGADIGTADIRDASGATVIGQFNTVALNDFFLDFNAPDQGGEINVLLSGGQTPIPNDFLSDEPGSDFTIPGTSDDGVGGTFAAASDNFQIDVIDGSGATLFEDVAQTAELTENEPGATANGPQNIATVVNIEDNLGNAASSISITNSADFGIDFNAPAASNELPEDGGSSSFVFNGDGTDPTNDLRFELADPALSNGDTPSGTVHGSTVVTITDGAGNVLVGPDATPTTTGATTTQDPPTSTAAQGTQVAEFVFQDAAQDPNVASLTFTYILDTEAPSFGALNPAPQSTGTDATSVFQDIGGTISDANEIASASIEVRADGDDAQGTNSDGVCQTDDYLLSVSDGEIDRNEIDLTNGTSSIEFDETFEIEDPFPSGSDTVKYCYFVNATDEALDNTGAADGNSATLNTESDIQWQN